MIERLGLLFADGSMLVLPEGTSLGNAQREAREADFGEPAPRTQVVTLGIEIRDHLSH